MAFQGILGVCVLLGLAWALSEDRRAVGIRTVAAGLAVQAALAFVLLKTPAIREAFLALNDVVHALQEATRAGTTFAFGYVGGGALPFQESVPGSSFVLAFQALPLILVMSALSAILFYWRVLPVVVRAFAWALERALGVGGAVGVGAAANVFVGMVEAPLLIRPYLASLGRGELFTVMTCGMATIAGTVMALYATFLQGVIPGALGHILTASLINAPAAILIARIMIPDPTHTGGAGFQLAPSEARGTMDALTRGALDGVQLLINVTAMLVVLVALVSLANQILGLLPDVAGAPLALERVLGWIMAPVTWLMGIPWAEAPTAGALMGTKTVLNELLAYLNMSKLPEGALSERSRLIMTYAMCGFANLGSLGIMIGGLGAMAPERRGEVVELGLRAILAGTIATCLTGALVGLMI